MHRKCLRASRVVPVAQTLRVPALPFTDVFFGAGRASGCQSELDSDGHVHGRARGSDLVRRRLRFPAFDDDPRLAGVELVDAAG